MSHPIDDKSGASTRDDEWVRHENATVVECPGCGFCFDEGHTDMDGIFFPEFAPPVECPYCTEADDAD